MGHVFYALRTLSTGRAAARETSALRRRVEDVETSCMASPRGRFIVLSPTSPVRAELSLTRTAKKAFAADPLTATTQELRIERRAIPDLRLPSHPVVVRLL
jgi:hypothetical protein